MVLYGILHKVADGFWRLLLRPKDDFIVILGQQPQKGSLIAVINPYKLWKKESFFSKLKYLLAKKWEPSADAKQLAAKDIFLNDLFGAKEDFGDVLYDLITEHCENEWRFAHLTNQDVQRADALEKYTVGTRTRLRNLKTIPSLNLKFQQRSPELCMLVFPMVVKVPIFSLRYFIDIHVSFVFNEVRHASHPYAYADDIISLLYEILFLQQKTAIALSDFLRLASQTRAEKGNSVLTQSEIDAIMCADLLFSYLKASIEKTIALLGYILSINKLEEKKTQKARLKALNDAIPSSIKETFYCGLILDFISSESLSELNRYRSGLFHKKGIADLQPHNYTDISIDRLPFLKLFSVLHEQHTKNSAVLLATLALLTDELVRRLPPVKIPRCIMKWKDSCGVYKKEIL